MPWPLQDRFNAAGPISQVPRDWFETIAKTLKWLDIRTPDNLTEQAFIEKPAAPSSTNPWRIVLPDYSNVYAAHSHWHDTSDIKSTGEYLINRRLMVFNSGTDVQATIQTIDSLLIAIDDAGTKAAKHVLALTGTSPNWGLNWEAALTVSTLAGGGSGFVVFDDTTDSFRAQIQVRPTTNLVAETVSYDRTVCYFAAGSEMVAGLRQIDYLLGDIPASGTKAAGLALVLTGSAGNWACNWATVTGVAAPGTVGRILYDNGSAWVALAAGTSGYYLKCGGAGAPSWDYIRAV